LTLAIDEELLLAARKVALDQKTSVNQLVWNYLASLMHESSRKRASQRAVEARICLEGIVEVGDRKWIRDDLYAH
jgi:Family of unknown function (DUF6364)